MSSYKDYTDKYGNFTHILNIIFDEGLSDHERQDIIFKIYDILNDKFIDYIVSNTNLALKWRISKDTDLLHYYTDSLYYSDKGVKEHTKILMHDIRAKLRNNKFHFVVTKPLAKSVLLLPDEF